MPLCITEAWRFTEGDAGEVDCYVNQPRRLKMMNSRAYFVKFISFCEQLCPEMNLYSLGFLLLLFRK